MVQKSRRGVPYGRDPDFGIRPSLWTRYASLSTRTHNRCLLVMAVFILMTAVLQLTSAEICMCFHLLFLSTIATSDVLYGCTCVISDENDVCVPQIALRRIRDERS